MFATTISQRPPKSSPKSKREYEYILDHKLLQAFPDRLLPCKLNRAGIIQKVHADVCKLNRRDEIFHMQRPLLVQKTPSSKSSSVRPSLRLVYYCWRDLSEYPQFTERLHDVRTSHGRNVTLQVRVTGHPECEVRWYKDDTPLTRHRPTNVEVRQYSKELFVLYIRGAIPADTGIYSCSAFNSAGTVRTSAYVHVERYVGPYLPVQARKVCDWSG